MIIRFFSFVFHFALAVILLGLSIVAFASGNHNLQLDWLPWSGPTQTYWLLGLGLGLYAAFRRIDRLGAAPFPPFPDSDLPSVLKALWLQQRFGRFAEAHQGDDPARLHAAFAAFHAATRPADLSEEVSQPPGVVRSDDVPLPEPERQAYAAVQP